MQHATHPGTKRMEDVIKLRQKTSSSYAQLKATINIFNYLKMKKISQTNVINSVIRTFLILNFSKTNLNIVYAGNDILKQIISQRPSYPSCHLERVKTN